MSIVNQSHKSFLYCNKNAIKFSNIQIQRNLMIWLQQFHSHQKCFNVSVQECDSFVSSQADSVDHPLAVYVNKVVWIILLITEVRSHSFGLLYTLVCDRQNTNSVEIGWSFVEYINFIVVFYLYLLQCDGRHNEFLEGIKIKL